MAMKMGEGGEFGMYFGDESMGLYNMGWRVRGGEASKVIWVSSWSP